MYVDIPMNLEGLRAERHSPNKVPKRVTFIVESVPLRFKITLHVCAGGQSKEDHTNSMRIA